MKTLTILFVTVIMMGVGCSKNEDSENNPDRPNKPSPLPDLPDPNDVCSCMDDIIFMQYCYDNFDVNKDGKVSQIEAAAVTEIDLTDFDIKTLTGIGYFSNLEILNCEGCKNLTSVDLSNNLKISRIGDSMFNGCNGLSEIIFNTNIVEIGEWAFSDCSSLKRIDIPETVINIKQGAFYDCSSLTNISIPETVTEIRTYTFYNCSSLTDVTFEEGSKLQYITGHSGNSIVRPIVIFENCTALTNIEIPASVKTIEGPVFYNCSSLTEINLPASLTSIGEDAFRGCSSLTEIHLPDNLTSIRSYTFNFCSSLTEIHLPANLTLIGDHAFAYCSSLTEIHLPASLTSIGENAFDQCTSLMKIMCYALTPPTISGCSLFGFAHSGHLLYNRSENLYVPAESIQAYKDSDWAYYFENILPIE